MRILFLLFWVLAAPSAALAQQAAAVFLTWSDDPTTTLSVDWHLLPGDDLPAVEIRGPGLEGWQAFPGASVEFPYSERTVRRAQITGLSPDALYELRVGGDGPVYRYRSLPATMTRPIRFATGGDTQFSDEAFGTMNRVVAAHDPDFVLFGGDLSYANGDPRRVERKEGWFETATRSLVAEGNRLIPVIVAIGNHEVWESRRLSDDEDANAFHAEWGLTERQATYFEPLFAFPREGFHDVLDFGDYLAIVALDSNHMTEVEDQTAWLDQTLAARTERPHVFPVYHVPAYPSVRRFDGSVSRRIRENWVPLFETHGVRLVFENHDHVYKRTIPLRGGEAHPSGIVYIGDGAWGVGTREIGRDQGGEPAWYLARGISQNHGILVTLDGPHQHVLVLNREGEVIDEYPVAARVENP
jgi:3',5'-cyclic AMP phosphodiesterase CpdA